MRDDSPDQPAGAVSPPGVLMSRYRIALWLFAAVAVVMIFWSAQRAYFIYDDWTYWTVRQDFVAEGGFRGILKLLFVPHNGQLPTLTFLVWLPLDWFFGMHTYMPYVIPVVLVHLATGLLLFELLVTRVRPGVALGASVLYLFMGNSAGASMTASHLGWTIAIPAVLFGLLAIERYEGIDDRRLVVATAGAALISGTAMGFVVLFVLGLALVIRTRYAIAAVDVAVFLAVWVSWRLVSSLFAITSTGGGGVSPSFGFGRVGSYVSYVWKGLTNTVGDLFAMGPQPLVLPVLIAVVVAALRSVADGREFVFAASAAGGLFFYLLVAMRGVELDSSAYAATQPRYMLVAGTLMLPSMAWAADRFVDLRRWVAVPLVVILGWAVIGNVSRHSEISEERLALGAENRTTIETAASMLESVESLEPLESLDSPASPGYPESLEDGLLLAGHSARISFQQLERLSSLGKLPCVVDPEQASALARRLGLAEPLPVQLACG